MASSRKSNCDLSERIAGALVPCVPPGSTILLGLSGGLDSVVLFHLLQHLAPLHHWRLSALHVHHGLSPHADDWAAFCRELCARSDIPLLVEKVDIAPLREMGIEAAARQLRHAVLDRQPVDFIALAHHRDDQVETLLLQLLRGGGVKGAAAMPAHKVRQHAPDLLRPLLGADRAELLAYAQQHGLRWIEDESNADDRYPRNFLRHRVLPLIATHYPGYRATLARSAEHFAEANALLDELAAQDAATAMAGQRLSVAALRGMGEPRARNLLRYFLRTQGAPLPDASRLAEMLRQLCAVGGDNDLCVAWRGWQLRCYREHAYVLPEQTCAPYELIWCGEDRLALPEPLGALHFKPVLGAGLSLAKLQQARVSVRCRRGGERLRVHDGGHHSSLKNLMQQHAVPPWLRDSWPLLFCDDELVWVDGVGVAEIFAAQQNEPGIDITR